MTSLTPRSIPLVLASTLAGCSSLPGVVINEFMAENDTTLADGVGGEYHDWIELHNTSDEPLSLEGMFLTEDIDDPTMEPLSPQLLIPAGGFLVLWASQGAENNAAHLSFALAREGEELGLYWQDPSSGNLVLLDGVVFDEQLPDVSFARDEDGIGAWGFCAAPTPGASNS